MMYRVIVELILEVDCEAEAYDAVNEILREQQRTYTPTSCLIDYATMTPEPELWLDAATYEEGDAFWVGKGEQA